MYLFYIDPEIKGPPSTKNFLMKFMFDISMQLNANRKEPLFFMWQATGTKKKLYENDERHFSHTRQHYTFHCVTIATHVSLRLLLFHFLCKMRLWNVWINVYLLFFKGNISFSAKQYHTDLEIDGKKNSHLIASKNGMRYFQTNSPILILINITCFVFFRMCVCVLICLINCFFVIRKL